jgi:hypothetical protein
VPDDGELISILGRQEYFWALQDLWPDVLEALHHGVFPVYEPIWHQMEGGRRVPIGEGSWEELKKRDERHLLQSAIEEWADQYSIVETWVFEAALDTLLTYYLGSEPLEAWLWRYNPRGYHPLFEPRFSQNVWYPSSRGWPESWEAFKKRMQSEFAKQLVAYRRMVETKFAIGKEEHLDRDARWTVLYRKGQSVRVISNQANLKCYSDPEQAVFRAIERFARLIGLDLTRRKERT